MIKRTHLWVAVFGVLSAVSSAAAYADVSQYNTVKSVVSQLVRSGSLTEADLRAVPPYWRGEPDNIYIHGCSIDLATNDTRSWVFNYQYIALQTVIAEAVLMEEGYPRELWSQDLSQFERDAVAAARNTQDPYDLLLDFNDLAADLSERLGASPRTGRFIDPDGGGDCGDGGFTVVFRSDPPGASLWMIVEFDFLLCELEGRNPWSVSECGWYEEQVFGDDQDWGYYPLVSGIYRYIARWPDGTTACGTRRFLDEGLKAAERDFSFPVVWIRDAGCSA